MFGCKLFNSDMGSVPLTKRQTSPSELGPENLDLSSFNGSYRMWRRLVHFMLYIFGLWPSVLWRCWLGGRKGIWPVKTMSSGVLSWLSVWSMVQAQLIPLPLTISCFSKIQIVFTFLVPAHPGSPGQKAVKWVCVFDYIYCCYGIS